MFSAKGETNNVGLPRWAGPGARTSILETPRWCRRTAATTTSLCAGPSTCAHLRRPPAYVGSPHLLFDWLHPHRKDSRRKEEREHRRVLKESQKSRKQEELRRLRDLKKMEILKKLREIERVSGAPGMRGQCQHPSPLMAMLTCAS